MYRRSAQAPEERHASEDIIELRRSHAQLTLQVSTLASDLRNSLNLFHSERLVLYNHLREQEDNAIMRVVQFARIRAKKALIGPSSELGKASAPICSSNSVVQTLLRSSASDCTLFEFQLFATKILSDQSIHCHALPSEYHVQFPNTNSCTRLVVVFETYADICRALQIDASTRESAFYREKKSRVRKTISAQVLGVEFLTSKDRRILLGCNFPSRQSPSRLSYLYQESIAWFEGSWEFGFSVRSNSASEFYTLTDYQQTTGNGHSHIRPQASHTFSISWEPVDSDIGHGTSTKIIAGALRSFFPAVVLRTQILTSTARNLLVSSAEGQCLTKALSNPVHEG